MTSLATRFSGLNETLRRQATPRALLGLGVRVASVRFFALDGLGSHTARIASQVDQMQREVRLYEAVLADPDWVDRSVEAREALEEARSGFWQGDTSGIIAAQLQGSVETAARTSGVLQPRVSVLSPPAPLGDEAVLFEISVSARDNRGQFLAFFQEIARGQGTLIPVGFSWNRITGQLEIQLVAPGVVQSSAPGEPQP